MNKEILSICYKYALHLTKNHEDAQDIAQQTVVKLLDKNESSVPNKAYLFTIIKNLVIDNHRRNKHSIYIDSSNEGLSNVPAKKDSYIISNDILSRLSSPHRNLAELLNDGYTNKEIAYKLHISRFILNQRIGKLQKHINRYLYA